MAEVIAALGVIASVAQLADYGFKLSVKLFTYGEAVYSADKSIKGISSDVSLTSTVLKELCQILKTDESRVVSDGALLATEQTVKDCLAIFKELDEALDKSLGVIGDSGTATRGVTKRRVVVERLKWPFKQPKMELLRSNLDRLKASLTLMLQVLSYARDVSKTDETKSSLEYQKLLIESLSRSERGMRKKYNEMQRALEFLDHRALNPVTNAAVGIMTNEEFAVATSSEWETLSASKARILLVELLLCVELLKNLAIDHVTSENDVHLSNKFNDLRTLLPKLQQGEKFQEIKPSERSEATKNILNRMNQIIADASFEHRSGLKQPPQLATTKSGTLSFAPSAPYMGPVDYILTEANEMSLSTGEQPPTDSAGTTSYKLTSPDPPAEPAYLEVEDDYQPSAPKNNTNDDKPIRDADSDRAWAEALHVQFEGLIRLEKYQESAKPQAGLEELIVNPNSGRIIGQDNQHIDNNHAPTHATSDSKSNTEDIKDNEPTPAKVSRDEEIRAKREMLRRLGLARDLRRRRAAIATQLAIQAKGQDKQQVDEFVGTIEGTSEANRGEESSNPYAYLEPTIVSYGHENRVMWEDWDNEGGGDVKTVRESGKPLIEEVDDLDTIDEDEDEDILAHLLGKWTNLTLNNNHDDDKSAD